MELPLVVPCDADGTLPRPAPEAPSPAAPAPSADDLYTRLASVATLWGVLRHFYPYFYPYFEEVGVDWDAVLPESLARAALDRDPIEHLATLRRMTAALDDGHAGVSFDGEPARAPLPVRFVHASGRIVVAEAGRGVEGGRRGDILLRIGRRSARDRLEDEERRVSGSPQWKRHLALRALRQGPPGEEIELELDSVHGERSTVRLRYGQEAPLPEPGPAVRELEPGIWYVHTGRITDADLEAFEADLAGALVLDVRTYPSASGGGVLRHVLREPVRSPDFLVPTFRYPDARDVTYDNRPMFWPVERPPSRRTPCSSPTLPPSAGPSRSSARWRRTGSARSSDPRPRAPTGTSPSWSSREDSPSGGPA